MLCKMSGWYAEEETVCIGFDEIDEAGEVECPCCGAVLEFEIEEEEEEIEE